MAPPRCACTSAAAPCRRRACCPSIRTPPPLLRILRPRHSCVPAHRIDGPRMLWACLLLPRLALDAVRRTSPADHDAGPLALITGPAAKRVLLDANAAARAAGLHRGQPLLAA